MNNIPNLLMPLTFSPISDFIETSVVQLTQQAVIFEGLSTGNTSS
jgi:hypothetical protein